MTPVDWIVGNLRNDHNDTLLVIMIKLIFTFLLLFLLLLLLFKVVAVRILWLYYQYGIILAVVIIKFKIITYFILLFSRSCIGRGKCIIMCSKG